MKLSLKEHIQRSKDAVSANKAKGNRHAEILTGLYTDLNRFIEEVIQNAEDAYRRKIAKTEKGKIKFLLFNDRIEVLHNGKDFDENDLMSITTFANTTKDKKNEVNLIGKFGIGFKSVFSITDEPAIHSGNYNYKITDFEVLEETHVIEGQTGFGTRIVLPFKNDKRNDIFNSVRSGLKQINSYYLIFLDEIKSIEIVFENGQERTITCVENILKDGISKKKFIINEIKEIKEEEYLVFTKNKEKNEELQIGFRLGLNDGKEEIVQEIGSCAFVYFPTRHQTDLKFLINARFTTTPTREYIPFDKIRSPENFKILKDAGDFFRTVLVKIKENGFFNSSFFNILPLEDPEIFKQNFKENEIYKMFYDITLDVLKTKKIIPVIGKRHSYASEIAFSRSSALTELLNKTDLELLFNKKEWLDCDEIYNDQIFDEYFSGKLDMKKVDAESFAFRIAVNPEVLKNKNEKWFILLYSFLLQNRQLWDETNRFNYYSLRSKPILLTESGELLPAYDISEIMLAYLPAGRLRVNNTIKRSLLKNNDVVCFFKELGLKEPDIFAEVRNLILPSYQDPIFLGFAAYSKNIQKIIVAWSEASLNQRAELTGLLQESHFILSHKNNFERPRSIFIGNKILYDYFEGIDNISFISEKVFRYLMNENFSKENIDEFFRSSGVCIYPQINHSEGKVIIEGFENMITNPSLKKTRAFLKILLKIPSSNLLPEVVSYISNSKWIFVNKERVNTPGETDIFKYATKAGLAYEEAERLSKVINFKSNSHTKITEKQRKVLRIFETLNISLDDFETDDEHTDASLNGEILVTDIDPLNDNKINSGQAAALFNSSLINGLEKMIFSGFKIGIPEEIKNIVFKILSDETADIHDIDIIDNNKHIGSQADFLLKKEGNIIKYIFIAEKTEYGSAFELDQEKWDEIEKLAGIRSGHMTFIYVYSKTKRSVIRINDPFNLLSLNKLHKKSIKLLLS